jgi:hypothetical protein
MVRAAQIFTATCCAAVVVACTPGAEDRSCQPLRIMPLGDSITEAEDGHTSYRYWLFRALVSDGRRVDFVGSQSGVFRGTPRFADFDPDHEGHWGWSTARVREYIDEWAARSAPDLVLLLLGTNDGVRDLGATTGNLTAIIESLRAHRPGVSVLLAEVPPVGDPETGATWPDIPRLNRAIATVADRLDAPGARVVVVDQYADFDVRSDTYDGVHPNESGEKKLAERWLAAIRDVAPFSPERCEAR